MNNSSVCYMIMLVFLLCVIACVCAHLYACVSSHVYQTSVTFCCPLHLLGTYAWYENNDTCNRNTKWKERWEGETRNRQRNTKNH